MPSLPSSALMRLRAMALLHAVCVASPQCEMDVGA